jgi:EmrB/QacA subfamily drug resistance transporter
MARKWWTLLAVCLGTFMLLLDITIVNVALPDIQKELGSSFSDLQWVVDAYALTLAALLLTGGSMADKFGRRRVFAMGLVLFSTASALCGLATTPLFLNLARALQGTGGALMFATSLALLAHDFRGADRGTAFGAWGATTGAAVAVGPLVGGALTQGLGWEWIFFVNVPIGIGTLALTLARVTESRDEEAGAIDWPGVLSFSGALFALVFALIRGNAEGWGSPLIVTLLLAAVVLLLAFVAVERRTAHPMLDLSLFRKPAFTGAATTAFVLSASMFAMFLYIVLYIQNILGYSPLEAGLRFLPITLLSFFVAPIAGKLSARFPVRIFLGAGLLLVALGLLLMHGISQDSDWTALLAGFIAAGAGIGLINPPLASTAVGVVEPRRSGMASGINTTFRQVGIATGIAGLGAVFQARVESKLADLLASVPSLPPGKADAIAGAVASGGAQRAVESAPPASRQAVGRAAREAFIGGLNELFLIGAAVALIGAILAFVLVRGSDFVAAPGADQQPVEQAAAA